MRFLLNTHFHLAVDSLRQNRGRTFLSALGIAIGVASIVLILSLTGGINHLISTSSNKDNANLILVRPSNGKEITDSIIDELTNTSQYSKSNLTLEDVKTIKEVDKIKDVAPLAISNSTITIADKSYPSTTVVATNNDLKDILGLQLKSGQFLDYSLKKNVAVLGYHVAEQLFGTTEAATRTFTYNNQQFMVVGVLSEINDPINFNGVDFDNSILIDIDFASTFESSIQIQQIDIRTETTDAVNDTMNAINEKLEKSKKSNKDYQLISGTENLHPAGSLLSIISNMLTLVASISLVVGGVGIMNIMLVSVSERTREIGIRKAVGASSSHVLLQFLFESIILSVIGGLMGFVLGYIFAFLISLITPFAPHISWQILGITGAVSLIVGILFGVYPALKAARKDPITSLKFYR
ncbi:ABC transporter permease [Candidatus Saccharibacteria bacterium]|nr:ABC transporter permease [Candidatus Saccharibacteria bacterium]